MKKSNKAQPNDSLNLLNDVILLITEAIMKINLIKIIIAELYTYFKTLQLR